MKALKMHKSRTLSEIIKGYEKEVIDELAERMKDVIYMTAKEKAQRILESLDDVFMSGEDTIDVEYNFSYVVNDILQLIGRIEREGEKNELSDR